ncbi:hypothetical protein T484DRAFT_1877760, partial [Baffinella frigidus]
RQQQRIWWRCIASLSPQKHEEKEAGSGDAGRDSNVKVSRHGPGLRRLPLLGGAGRHGWRDRLQRDGHALVPRRRFGRWRALLRGLDLPGLHIRAHLPGLLHRRGGHHPGRRRRRDQHLQQRRVRGAVSADTDNTGGGWITVQGGRCCWDFAGLCEPS